MSHVFPDIARTTTGGDSDVPVLAFDRVTLEPTWPYDTAPADVRLQVGPGELVLITLEAGRVRSPFADLAQGLTDPHEGEVRVLGRAWPTMSAGQLARSRARVGRVFDVGGWVSNLDVDENVLLARRYHGGESTRELRRRAEALARAFGLEGLHAKRPAVSSQHELRVSQWVRALLGEASLIILERPTRDVRPESVPPFLDAIAAARARGAAVLWTTTDGATVGARHNPAPPDVTARFAVRGRTLVPEPNR